MNTVSNLADRAKKKTEGIVLLDYEFPSEYPEFAYLGAFPKTEEGEVKGFEINRMELWSHEDCIKGRASGEMVLEYLRYNYLLEDCIGLQELGGIYRKGPLFFEEHFGDKAVFAWQAVFKMPRDWRIPYLIIFGGSVVFCLHWIGALCKENFVALRHTESSRLYTTPREEIQINDNIVAFKKVVSLPK